MADDPVEFDEGKAAQLSATFAITIFLSMLLLVANGDEIYTGIEKLLWTASSFFCAAAMRLLDKIFDHDRNLQVIFNMFTIKTKSFLSLDERWLSYKFTFYFFGWVAFLSAFFSVGILLFDVPTPSSLNEFFFLFLSHFWFMSIVTMLVYVTIASVTREFLFRN